MTNGQMTETQVLEYLKHIPQKTTEQTIAEMRKEFPKEHLQAVRYYYKNYAEIVTESAKINGKELCDKFKETPEWKNGKTNCGGYATCCIWLGFCGGMSGWIIALIVLLILGTCAAGAAAFYFFYWRRKNGGQEAKEEKEEETTDGTVMEEIDVQLSTVITKWFVDELTPRGQIEHLNGLLNESKVWNALDKTILHRPVLTGTKMVSTTIITGNTLDVVYSSDFGVTLQYPTSGVVMNGMHPSAIEVTWLRMRSEDDVELENEGPDDVEDTGESMGDDDDDDKYEM